MVRRLLENHVFANLTFALVLVTGFLAYALLPRQQDPDMNFNWISIITALPGGSAEEVERLVTDPLEEALEKIADVKFVISGSREGVSDILLRFDDMDDRTFDKRVNDLRREIRNKERELPQAAEDPLIMEITSNNGFPTATVVVRGQADDENLRRQARYMEKDLEQIPGVDAVLPLGLRDPELQVRFSPARLSGFGIAPTTLADTVAARFRDVAGGSLPIGRENRLLRFQGTTADPEVVAQWQVIAAQGLAATGGGDPILLGDVAEVRWGREKGRQVVRYEGQPAVLLSITKRSNVNSLTLTRRIREYLQRRQELQVKTGVDAILADDQTPRIRNALGTMETTALLGLFLVVVTTWLFLGSRIALIVGLGIPFTLAGTFGLLYSFDHSLNVMVLLGVVIALGMLVDDAVVVVESIYVHIQRGMDAMSAGIAALREVAAPVTTSVFTTMAAFLPLMLLPGIMGKFMRVVPLVVTIALAISLAEAFWMAPTHVAALSRRFSRPSRLHAFRTRALHRLRITYVRLLVRVLRRPRISLLLASAPFGGAVAIMMAGLVHVSFFAMDPIPLFYVNIKMPAGTTLEHTVRTAVKVEQRVRKNLHPGEARAVVTYAGQMFTEIQPFFGDRYGQILVSLVPDRGERRPVADIIAAMRDEVTGLPGPENISFLPLSGGPPVTKPISVKVRGDDFKQLRAATADIQAILAKIPDVSDITDDFSEGSPELVLKPNDEAIRRAGLAPALLSRFTRLLADGEVAAQFQHQGEKVTVRILASHRELTGIDGLLQLPIARPGGGIVPLGVLANHEARRGMDAVRHFNFRRAITVEADINKDRLDTVTANNRLKAGWAKIQDRYPGVDLDFSGILDDINEAVDAIGILFLFGVGLMYVILGTQFRSYFQPLLILTTVPMAFTGVVFGLLIGGHPLSLYTLFGVVALSGIAVNASIVLISAANERRAAGMGVMTAIIFAARRRVVPILITTVTTIAGLLSLALGLGGHSLLWGPVATAIVWGLAFSTLLTLFLVPLLYATFIKQRTEKGTAAVSGG